MSLRQASGLGSDRIGSKAANLAKLAVAGFPVPPGFVIPTDSFESWEELSPALAAAAAELGDVRLAVRSSATAEDLAGNSYAGQYETFLDVGLDGLEGAVRRCLESARASRVAAYQVGRDAAVDQERIGMAVLVMPLIRADAAGVAFTANPVSGDRNEVVITAVRGLGERLVSGEAVGDEWAVREGHATLRRETEKAIDADKAIAIGELARRVEAFFGEPQDVEWAIKGSELYLLQARPMTALPESPDWTPPAMGYWMRNFRIGEWLHEPMTPLFRTWLLELIEGGYLHEMSKTIGTAVAFPHAAINGWYYTATPKIEPFKILRAIVQSRGKLISFLRNVLIRVSTEPEISDRAVLRGLYEYWRDRFLLEYRRLLNEGDRRMPAASPEELVRLIDELGDAAGEYFFLLAVVGGSAWKMEGCLARFYQQHLLAEVGASVQVLLSGLPGTEPKPSAFAVQSLDWFWSTAGEMGSHPAAPADPATPLRLAAERQLVEAKCRAALATKPQLLARFETLLEVSQRYAAIREEQSGQLTLPWPVLRRCALRLGESLQSGGVIARVDDIFFLVRDELFEGSPQQDVVSLRRAEWERQRRLIAPLTIGKVPKLIADSMTGTVDAVRTTKEVPVGAVVGDPASPGRASGPVRIVRSPDDFDLFQSGEVLVAQSTAPAWTPLFARAAAVVTDGGTLAAHASLVAREYGIPAVVGTGDATIRLRDGQVVVVDGGAGMVIPGHLEK